MRRYEQNETPADFAMGVYLYVNVVPKALALPSKNAKATMLCDVYPHLPREPAGA